MAQHQHHRRKQLVIAFVVDSVNRRTVRRVFRFDRGGFTLVELVIVIVILGILAAVAIPAFVDMSESSKVVATKKEMQALKRALVGNPEVVSGGQYVHRGFEGDVGYLPGQLVDLAVKPDSVSTYNKLTRLGWNGPYIDSSGGDYLNDAWSTAYVYEPANRRLRSIGGQDTITITF
ncbi:MAG: prepilin-type N-terminal cleavage/methylation domain-containing protein [Candidatus Zixiibacteriota bacterium]